MAKASATIEDTAVATAVPSVNGNDPIAVHDESNKYFEEMFGETMGKYRWRILAPEFAVYVYFDCDLGKSEEARVRGEYSARTGVTGVEKHKFEFMGLAEGPAPRGERIPRDKMMVKKPSQAIINMMN